MRVQRLFRAHIAVNKILYPACTMLFLILLLAGCSTTSGNTPATAARETRSAAPLAYQGEGSWYRGDLHAHSLYSDGDSPITEVIRYAEKEGLDFFVVTDHDTSMQGEPDHWNDPGYCSDTLTLLYGVEWTSQKGHANVFSTQPFDYGQLWQANRELDARQAIEAARSQGAIFSINHPATFFAPWEYPRPQQTDCIEIWNAPFRFPSDNREAIEEFWEPLLLDGHMIPGIAGSDSHHLKGYQRFYNPPGQPTTWVYADEKTSQAILDALKNGHVTISNTPQTERFELTADRDGDGNFETLMGENLPLGDEITLRLSVVPSNRWLSPAQQEEVCCRTAKARLFAESIRDETNTTDRSSFSTPGGWHWSWYKAVLIKNGSVIGEYSLREGRNATVTVRDTPTKRSYYRAELYALPWGGEGQDLVHTNTFAVTNPIYVGYK